jgi:hypothetical protein
LPARPKDRNLMPGKVATCGNFKGNNLRWPNPT